MKNKKKAKQLDSYQQQKISPQKKNYFVHGINNSKGLTIHLTTIILPKKIKFSKWSIGF